MITIATPNLSHQSQWEAMIAQWDLTEDIAYILPRALFQGANYSEFLANYEEVLHHPKNGFAPVELFFIMHDDLLIGGIILRHRAMISTLQNVGGHVEYAIAPLYRGKWYATAALWLLIEEAKKRGFEQLLLTCSALYPAQAKVAEHNGAIFTKHAEYNGERKRNYLIRLT